MTIRYIIDLEWSRPQYDPILGLRMLLKRLLRTYGARCISCDMTTPNEVTK